MKLRKGFKTTITLDNGRKYKLHDCRIEGTSLFGKLPNGIEIELLCGTPVTHEEFELGTRPTHGSA
jgi:hypothetical protein